MTPSRIDGRVSATVLILIAALAAALGLWFGARLLGTPKTPPLQAAVLYPAPRALPPFNLVRSNDTPLTLADMQGHWTIAFFGYTNCPDVCPTTLATFKQVWKRLDPALAQKLRFAFVSVDPVRDTPAQLTRYVGYFNPDFIAATGSDEELTAITRALGLVYSHEESDNGNYVVDHSASAVIIDPQARHVGLFRPPFNVDAIVADLSTLAGS